MVITLLTILLEMKMTAATYCKFQTSEVMFKQVLGQPRDSIRLIRFLGEALSLKKKLDGLQQLPLIAISELVII